MTLIVSTFAPFSVLLWRLLFLYCIHTMPLCGLSVTILGAVIGSHSGTGFYSQSDNAQDNTGFASASDTLIEVSMPEEYERVSDNEGPSSVAVNVDLSRTGMSNSIASL